MKKKTILWLVLGALAIALVAMVTMTPAAGVNKQIGSDELAQLQSAGATVVDVRTPAEFESGHIPSAVNVPVEQIQADSAGWNKDQPVVVYCATGARSAEAASYLAGAGFRKVYDLKDGVIAWTGKLDTGGATAAQAPVGAGAVATGGKPLFIEFSTST